MGFEADETTFVEGINGIGEVDKDFKVYDNIKGKVTKNVIDQYSNVEVIYHYEYEINEDEYENWYYVKSGNIKGWIKGELEYDIQDIDPEDLIIDPAIEPEIDVVLEPEPVVEEPKVETPEVVETKDKSLSFSEIATYCVCGAVVISIIAIIIVGVVNDKKKKAVVVKPVEETNNEEVKEEKKKTKIRKNKNEKHSFNDVNCFNSHYNY